MNILEYNFFNVDVFQDVSLHIPKFLIITGQFDSVSPLENIYLS